MASTQDLVEQFVSWTKNEFGPALGDFYAPGSAHVGTVAPLPRDMMPSHVGAFYLSTKPDSPLIKILEGDDDITPVTAMSVSLETAIMVAAFRKGRSRNLTRRTRLQFLREFKMELKFVVHEGTHAVGPKDIDEFQREVEATGRAGLTSWKEAITELSTQVNFNKIIEKTGLAEGDPWLLEVDELDSGSYVGMVEAAAVLVRGLSNTIPGADFGSELNALVAAGCGKTGLDNLLRQAFAAHGVHDERLVQSAERMVATSLTELQRAYLATLSRSEHLGRGGVTAAMDQLRARGANRGQAADPPYPGAQSGCATGRPSQLCQP